MQMVGAYPFERPEDKNDNQKLQKMIQVGSSLTHLAGTSLKRLCDCMPVLPSPAENFHAIV